MRSEEIESTAAAALSDLQAQRPHVWAGASTRQDLAEVIGRVERLWNDRAPLAFRTATSEHFGGIVLAVGEHCDEEADRAVALLQEAMSHGEGALSAHLSQLAAQADDAAPA